jgi:hypothetical protein
MRSLRVILLVAVSIVLGAVGVVPASAAKAPLATPQITSAVVLDTRTVAVTWTPVKGADHYVLASSAGEIRTTATSATVTGLYPGDDVAFFVHAETRKNQPSGTSEWVYVSLAPEGPSSPSGYAFSADTVRVWWGSGLGCYTYELAVAEGDGTYSVLAQLPNYASHEWQGPQAPATTVSYAVRCASFSGLQSPWSASTPVTTPEF